MKTNSQMQDDARMRVLLRDARPEPELPPGFQNAVWRRVERAERPAPALRAAGWMDALVAWFLRPRRAFVMAAAMLVLGISLGLAQGVNRAKDLAKARYLDSISPPDLRQ